jgi:prepilin-type N-terminal cleavage/methylation domain-containing protein
MMRRQQNGFSLLELMVSITISMVAMVAAIQMYSTTLQTRRIQAMQAPLTDEGRFAISMIQRIVSQAGFRQDPKAPVSEDRFSVASNVMTVKFDPDGMNQITCDGTVPTAGVAQSLVIQKSGTKLQCAINGAAAVEWIAPATTGIGNSAEVVDFGITFGIDTGPASTPENFGCGAAAAGVKPRDCIADSYVSSLTGGVTAAQIISARICLLLRSEAIDGSVQKPGNVTNCSGTAITNTQDDHKLYRTFRTTVLLKNR